jgi:hypothetical protein
MERFFPEIIDGCVRCYLRYKLALQSDRDAGQAAFFATRRDAAPDEPFYTPEFVKRSNWLCFNQTGHCMLRRRSLVGGLLEDHGRSEENFSCP